MDITRRNFIKGLIVFGTGAALMPGMVGCSDKKQKYAYNSFN